MLSRIAIGTDAGFYRLIPEIIVRAADPTEVAYILKQCNDLNIPLTFRAAGTSLSGQSVTDSVLLIAGNNWNKYSLNSGGKTITMQPGVRGGQANVLLKKYNRKIGPDPASLNSAMIGGIAANNASGMCCGISGNSYSTLHSMKIIFADGSLLDTSDNNSISQFKESHKDLIGKIGDLSERIKNDTVLTQKIKKKYSIKNTTGYSLNSFIDFTDPIDIIQHLMIGSEGTLGFISEITLNTIEEFSVKATALVLFQDIHSACRAVNILKPMPVNAVELMDSASLISVKNKNAMTQFNHLIGKDTAALLIETGADNKNLLLNNIKKIETSLLITQPINDIGFSLDPIVCMELWNIRKGLFPSIGAMRKTGTSVIIEDVAVDLSHLPGLINNLHSFFVKHGYEDAIIFGHALDGNIHFVFSQDFNYKDEADRYAGFMNDLAHLIIEKYDGSLKGEHGTGRNISPFVELEWGTTAYNLMKEIKQIFDPNGILNPGVIINPDPEAHLKNLKTIPAANPIIDKCTECGFCESSCVSADFTLSPRQRIAAFRELVKSKSIKRFEKVFDYQVNQTCAADGLCAINCPVDINTGELIKNLRSMNKSTASKIIASFTSANISLVTSLLRFALIAAARLKLKEVPVKIFGKTLLKGNKVSFSLLPPSLYSYRRIEQNIKSEKKVVYFTSCVNRVIEDHNNDKKDGVTRAFVSIANKAGFEVLFVHNESEHCCGLPFSSKGYFKQEDKLRSKLMFKLESISKGWTIPVVIDNSPCTGSLKENYPAIPLLDASEFILTNAIQELEFSKSENSVLLFPVCSSRVHNFFSYQHDLAAMCAEGIFIPETSCCGFAGDKGFSEPDLNTFAVEKLKSQLPNEVIRGYSSSRTCNIGLGKNLGINFSHLLFLVDKSTTSRSIP